MHTQYTTRQRTPNAQRIQQLALACTALAIGFLLLVNVIYDRKTSAWPGELLNILFQVFFEFVGGELTRWGVQ